MSLYLSRGGIKMDQKQPLIPEWIGNLPFPPKKKKSVVITKEMEVSYFYGFPGFQVECWACVCTDKITLAGYTLPPGTHDEPPGFHLHGDEYYYILEGEAVVFNPEGGETYLVYEGDTLFIPQRTRHQIFNFSNKKVQVLCLLAPKMWADDGMGTIIPRVKEPKFYKGKMGITGGEKRGQEEFIRPNINCLGKWPVDTVSFRAEKILLRIPKDKRLPLIHGEKNHVLFSFIVSSDYIHFGELTIPPNGYSEFEQHEGDEVIYALKGEVVIRISETDDPELERENAVRSSYRVREGEKMLIPEGIKHQYFNFSDEVTKTLFAIAPRL